MLRILATRSGRAGEAGGVHEDRPSASVSPDLGALPATLDAAVVHRAVGAGPADHAVQQLASADEALLHVRALTENPIRCGVQCG